MISLLIEISRCLVIKAAYGQPGKALFPQLQPLLSFRFSIAFSMPGPTFCGPAPLSASCAVSRFSSRRKASIRPSTTT